MKYGMDKKFKKRPNLYITYKWWQIIIHLYIWYYLETAGELGIF